MEWLLYAQNSRAQLPPLLWQQWWLPTAWGVVAAWMGVCLAGRWSLQLRAKIALGGILAIWVGLPGVWGGSYWLGLAFQSPSVSTVLVCGLGFSRALHRTVFSGYSRSPWNRSQVFISMCGIALGWALLLDTLGVWPGFIYDWGFGSIAPAIAVLIAALPWIAARKLVPSQSVVLGGTAIGFFLFLRLPTGNLFDALIDPWLWCYLQFALIRQMRFSVKRT